SQIEEVVLEEGAGTDYTAVDDAIESDEEAPPEEAVVVGEDTSMRSENIKHFIMSDHSRVAAVYAEPVHFEQEDKWIDIDNELIPVGEGEDGDGFSGYRTRSNSFKLQFAGEGDQNNFVSLTEGEYKVSWSPIYQPEVYVNELSGAAVVTKRTISADVTEQQTAVTPEDAEEFQLEKTESEILYKSVVPGVDFQYMPKNNGVKENIIVNRRGASYAYTFALSLEGLRARLTSDNTIELYDENDPASVQYVFPAPYMYDENGEQSTSVSYALTEVKSAIDLRGSLLPESVAEQPITQVPEIAESSSSDAETSDTPSLPETEGQKLLPGTDSMMPRDAGAEPDLIADAIKVRSQVSSASEDVVPDTDSTIETGDSDSQQSDDSQQSSEDDEVSDVSSSTAIPSASESEEFAEPTGEEKPTELQPVGDAKLEAAVASKLKTENYYLFTVTADEAWINTDGRAFPIVIDPVLEKKRKNSSDNLFGTLEYSCVHGDGDCNRYNEDTGLYSWAHVGIVGSEDGCSYGEFFIDLDNNFYDTQNFQVSKAIFRIRTSSSASKRVILYDGINIIDFGTIPANGADGANKSLTFDITRLFMGGDSWPIFTIEARDEEQRSSALIMPFYGSTPFLTITYRDFTGLESYISTHTQSVGQAGTGHITDYNGNLTFVHNDVTTAGNRMPATLQHIYNSYDNPNLECFDAYTDAGHNWRLNYQQTLSIPVGEADTATYPYLWVDGDGTKHYFKKATIKYWVNGADKEVSGAKDEDGLGLFVVPVSDSTLKTTYPFKIVDRSGSTSMYFDKAGRLGLITDSNQKENATNSSAKSRNSIQIIYSNAGITNASYDHGNYTEFLDIVQDLLDDFTNENYSNAEWLDYGREWHHDEIVNFYETCLADYEFWYGYMDPFIRLDKAIYADFNAFRGYIKDLYDSPTSSIATRKSKLNSAKAKLTVIQTNANALNTHLSKRMVKIIDGADKEINIAYAANGRISSISDPTRSGALRTYSYDISGNLIGITYPYPAPASSSASTSAYTYLNGQLASARDDTNYKINYSYSYGLVSRVDEYAGTKKGQSYSISYMNGETSTYRFSGEDDVHGNADDIITTYAFDYTGKTKIVRSECNGKLLGGASYAYTEDGGQDSNKLTEAAQGSAHAINLLKNHSFERGTGYTEHWTPYSSCTTASNHALSSLSSSKSFIGSRMAQLQAKKGHVGTMGYKQRVENLKANTPYTFSAYIKTSAFEGDAYISVAPVAGVSTIQLLDDESSTSGNFASSKPVPKDSDAITSSVVTDSGSELNAGWVRVWITFKLTQAGAVYFHIETNNRTAATKTTNAWFDCLQLEAGNVANPYNIIEDASFEQYAVNTEAPGYWTLSNNGVADTCFVSTGGIDGSKCYIIEGEYNKTKYLKLPVHMTNKASYVLSGWYMLEDTAPIKGDRQLKVEVVRPSKTNADGTLAYSTYTVAQNLETPVRGDWVYFCMALPKITNWSSAYIRFKHIENEGTLYIDNLQLLRQDALNNKYDSNGKLISRTAKAIEEKSTRTRGLVETHTDGSGNKATNTYDKATNDLNKTTYTVGPQELYSYDQYGNNIAQQTGANSLRYWTETAYTGDGRFVASTKDERGNLTTYNYNVTDGLLDRTTNAASVTTSYAYDPHRLRQTGVTTGGITNNYSYNHQGLLGSIRHNSFNYNFTYDAYGNQTAVKVGNTPLVQYTYGAYNGKLRKTTYGNGPNGLGDTVELVYDQNERVIQEKRNGRVVTENRYGNDGAVLQTFDYLNNLHYTYDYDAVGRLRRQYVWNNTTKQKLYEFEKIYDTAGRVAEVWYVLYTNGAAGPVQKYKYTYNKDNTPYVNTLPNGSQIIAGSSDSIKNKAYYDDLRRPKKVSYKPHSSAKEAAYLNTELTYTAGISQNTINSNYQIVSTTAATTTPLVATYINKIGTAQKDKFTYKYDKLGNITEIIDVNKKVITYT
ncbi:hypothetical protein LJC64_04855, partial [Ruminococcaceae bacterium OttesenSCG-928-A11]|nr:hypothetical protein [Ruminococcaceae bacterium OttesenSCG-928-A11]